MSDAPLSPHLIHGRWYLLFIAFLAAGIFVSLCVAMSIGSLQMPLVDVLRVLGNHVAPWNVAHASDITNQVVWDLRAPRALLALCAGGALAVAGTVLQAVVRNPLADPYILGAVNGAALGATIVIVLGSAAAAGLGVSSAAFVGAMVSLGAVFALGRHGGRFSPTRLVLAGVVVVVTGWLMFQARSLNSLLVGDETAYALGVDVSRFRAKLIVASALLTGVVVAAVGGIAFVGLMIPHIARLLVGPDYRRVLTVSVLLGASYLVWVDVLSRTLEKPAELPIGIITAAIGAPFFLFLMYRSCRVAGVG